MAQHNDFTQGAIVPKLLKFMLPILGALILQAMYGAVDILIVGRFGTTAGISGVSTGSSIVNLVTFTITGLSMGITVLILVENDGYRYPGMLIYAMALHAFIAVGVAVVNLFRFKHKGSPALYAAKALNLVAALMSMLALETALIDRYGEGGTFRRAMIGSTSAVVCAVALTAAAVMIVRATRGLKRAA